MHQSIKWLSIAFISWASVAIFAETQLSGKVEAEWRYFLSEALFEQQNDQFYSIAFEPELNWKDESRTHYINFKLFGRLDSSEGNRSHADIRELYYLYAGDGFEFGAGINKVFWGVTESNHLVDVINQTDLIESTSGEEKLGQPLIKMGFENDTGNLDIYLLPYFRTRTFAAEDERYQIGLPQSSSSTAIPIDENSALFESKQKRRQIDVAIRLAQSLGDVDLALSAFHGTDREPIPIIGSVQNQAFPRLDEIKDLTLYYPMLTQLGLELQYLWEDLTFKFEGAARYQSLGDYLSYVTGIEYTFADMDPFGQDIGILIEYLWHNRKTVDLTQQSLDATQIDPIFIGDNRFVIPGEYLSPFENDIFVGTRFNLNNIDSTEFVAGVIYDLETETLLTTFEGSSRIGDQFKLSLNLYFFDNVDTESSFYFSRRDDVFEIKGAWFF